MKQKRKYDKNSSKEIDEFINNNLDMEGFICFEEVSDSEYNKVISSQSIETKKAIKPSKKSSTKRPKIPKHTKEIKNDEEANDELELLEESSPWSCYYFHPIIQDYLIRKNFTTPSEIQVKIFKRLIESIDAHTGLSMVSERDVLGAAPTGSGKTLTFGLPIIHYLLAHPLADFENLQISALILVPTRELALQVSSHLNEVVKDKSIRLVSIVGGMSVQKQERQLSKKVHILIATPGRLWKLINQNSFDLKKRLSSLDFLVLDEVDRMIEHGHYKELNDIFEFITFQESTLPSDLLEENDDIDGNHYNRRKEKRKRQTLVFSATLILDRKYEHHLPQSGLDQIVRKIPFLDPKPLYIHVKHEKATPGLPSTIRETKISCPEEERDIYLYYFLLHHPGKTLIFVNSIDSLKRLCPLLRGLKLNVWPIHSQMPQRQRLKNLDRFKHGQNVILLASDVAGRGLDIPAVDNVIHYQVPRSSEIYVHRTGRTGRANSHGFSLLLLAPKEIGFYKKICHELKQDKEIEEYICDQLIWRELRERINVATKIDKLDHSGSKIRREGSWMKKVANSFDIELEEQSGNSQKRMKKENFLKKNLCLQLETLLNQPLAKSFPTHLNIARIREKIKY